MSVSSRSRTRPPAACRARPRSTRSRTRSVAAAEAGAGERDHRVDRTGRRGHRRQVRPAAATAVAARRGREHARTQAFTVGPRFARPPVQAHPAACPPLASLACLMVGHSDTWFSSARSTSPSASIASATSRARLPRAVALFAAAKPSAREVGRDRADRARLVAPCPRTQGAGREAWSRARPAIFATLPGAHARRPRRRRRGAARASCSGRPRCSRRRRRTATGCARSSASVATADAVGAERVWVPDGLWEPRTRGQARDRARHHLRVRSAGSRAGFSHRRSTTSSTHARSTSAIEAPSRPAAMRDEQLEDLAALLEHYEESFDSTSRSPSPARWQDARNFKKLLT